MGLTRDDLENLIEVIKVGNIIKISLDGTSKNYRIKSKHIEETPENTLSNIECKIDYTLEYLDNRCICYELRLNIGSVICPYFILSTTFSTYIFSLDTQDMDIVRVIDPRTNEILWNNRHVCVETTTNKINDNPIYYRYCDDVVLDTIGFDDDRVMAHIFTPKIKGIYANENNRTLVIKWETDEVTKVTCDEEDTFDLENGLARAIAKYVLGNNYNAGTIFNKYLKSIKLTKKKCPVVELAKEKKTQKKTRLHS